MSYFTCTGTGRTHHIAEMLESMPTQADDIEAALKANGFTSSPHIRQSLALAEEVGEFVGAVRRWSGLARRSGGMEDVQSELADVVITAFVTASTMNIDLLAAIREKLQIIYTRGWREIPLKSSVSGTDHYCMYCGPGYRYGSEGCRHTPTTT